ncbi:MAG TPA: hypothetical protein VEB20_21830 [Azospirillaceae bacterium]|nr:hypothetical protein [Azospirillaceae bacterium]
MRHVLSLLIGLVLCLVAGATSAQAGESVRLRIAAMPNDAHLYYMDLLRSALEAAGHAVEFDVTTGLPQPRIEAALREGSVDLHYFLRTPERDGTYLPVPVGLTAGLISLRVLLVRTEDVPRFAGVESLADLRALGMRAGFGQGWFDGMVWRRNQLPFMEVGGDWRNIYAMLAHGSRDIDYFPRGVTEILGEAQQHPELTIEPHLLLRYSSDQILYFSPARSALVPLVRQAMEAFAATGEIERRARARWGDDLESLSLDRRRAIDLDMPE